MRNDLKPVLNLDLRRSISSIVWRELFADDVVIAFAHNPQIYLFNLGEVNPESVHNPPLVVFTPDGKGTNSCGHQSILLWTKTIRLPAGRSLPATNNNNTIRKEDYLIAGSTNGFIRCWKINNYNLDAPSNSFPLQQNKCLWNIRNDISKPIDLARRIVSLFLIQDNSQLLAITDDGLLTVWDLIHLQTASFGSVGNEPKLLYSLSLTEKLLLSPITSLNNNTTVRANGEISLSPRLIRKVISHSKDPETKETKEYLILLEDGNIFLYHFLKRKLSFYPHQYDPNYPQNEEDMIIQASLPNSREKVIDYGRPMNAADENSDDDENDDGTIRRTTTTSGAAAGLPPPPDTVTVSFEGLIQLVNQRNAPSGVFSPDICSVNAHLSSSSSSSSHYFLSMFDTLQKRPLFRSLDLSTSFHNSFAHSSINNYCSRICSTAPFYKNSFGIIESALLRHTAVTYTLPGFIMFAETGDSEILLSQDLINYLGNSYLISNCLSKSNEIRIEYYLEDSPSGSDSDNHQNSNSTKRLFSLGRKLFSQDYTIEKMRSNYITLSQPYMGPPVVNGYPRIWIRTNLLMKGFAYDSKFYEDNFNKTASKLTLQNETLVNRQWPLQREISLKRSFQQRKKALLQQFPVAGTNLTNYYKQILQQEEAMVKNTIASSVVVVQSHPVYPLLFLGHANDCITVMNYSGHYLVSEAEEKKLTSFQTNEGKSYKLKCCLFSNHYFYLFSFFFTPSSVSVVYYSKSLLEEDQSRKSLSPNRIEDNPSTMDLSKDHLQFDDTEFPAGEEFLLQNEDVFVQEAVESPSEEIELPSVCEVITIVEGVKETVEDEDRTTVSTVTAISTLPKFFDDELLPRQRVTFQDIRDQQTAEQKWKEKKENEKNLFLNHNHQPAELTMTKAKGNSSEIAMNPFSLQKKKNHDETKAKEELLTTKRLSSSMNNNNNKNKRNEREEEKDNNTNSVSKKAKVQSDSLSQGKSTKSGSTTVSSSSSSSSSFKSTKITSFFQTNKL
jgi:hypothetical protein